MSKKTKINLMYIHRLRFGKSAGWQVRFKPTINQPWDGSLYIADQAQGNRSKALAVAMKARDDMLHYYR